VMVTCTAVALERGWGGLGWSVWASASALPWSASWMAVWCRSGLGVSRYEQRCSVLSVRSMGQRLTEWCCRCLDGLVSRLKLALNSSGHALGGTFSCVPDDREGGPSDEP
jgi:hypothetical protein